MEADEPLVRGTLLLPPSAASGALPRLAKKKWQTKYCMLFKASKQGIERLEIYDNKEDAVLCNCQKIITLENCIKITQTPPGSTNIAIVSKTQTQIVSALTESETLQWIRALQAVAFGDDSSHTVAIDEDNDLYCSSGEAVFSVKLCSSEASDRCGFEPIDYTLMITATALELRGVDDNKVYATWPYRYIRRYGYRRGKFTFEAGRKCETGEGTFHLEHSNQQEIFRCLSLKMKSMKKLITSGSFHSLDCGEQLHAALCMEARSRSPLPPSARSEEFEFGSVSVKSSTSLCHIIDSHQPLVHPNKPGIKPKPVKPPRKNIFSLARDKIDGELSTDNIEVGKYKKLDNYEPIANLNQSGETFKATPYDNVEVRNEAWKTLGITDIDHIEFAPTRKDENSLKLISRSQDNLNSINSGESSKIIILPSPDLDPNDANYDRLQFFGSTSKLNRSNGYKSVVARPQIGVNNNNETKGTWNDYDEVENVMQSVRLADDSYLGYGMIRKPSIPGPQVPIKSKPARPDDASTLYTDVDHCAYNGSSYAIVSKAKQV